MIKWTFLFLLVSPFVATDDGYRLVHIYPENEFHLKFLSKFNDFGFDVWFASEDRYDVFVPPSLVHQLTGELEIRKLPFLLSDIDFQKELEKEVEYRNKKIAFDYNLFNNLTQINTELDRLEKKCIPGYICKINSIGKSVEGRPLRRLQITKAKSTRKGMWVDSLTHAREWLTGATVMKILNKFFTNYTEPSVKYLLEKYDWHFIPIINPDGYEYSWQSSAIKNRYWRKNRRVNNNPNCLGVDLNRNADQFWGTEGASPNECDETYRGSSPASEPEIAALQKTFTDLGKHLIQVVSIHAYGNYWLIPFAHKDPKTNKCYEASDIKDTLAVANSAADAIQKIYNTKWKRGPFCNTLYTASGSFIDFAKMKLGIKYAAVPEVRGNNFVVPSTQIEPSFREIWAGLEASIKTIEKQSYIFSPS